MKVIIDISEDLYNRIFDGEMALNTDDKWELEESVKLSILHGKVLPKGHGDLIDRNDLLECSYKIDSMYCEYDEVVKVDDIKDAPTIIEADKEVGE